MLTYRSKVFLTFEGKKKIAPKVGSRGMPVDDINSESGNHEDRSGEGGLGATERIAYPQGRSERTQRSSRRNAFTKENLKKL